MPIEEKLQEPAQQLLAWAKMIQLVVKKAVQDYEQLLKSSVGTIPTFFTAKERPVVRPRKQRRVFQSTSTVNPAKMSMRGTYRTQRTTTPSDENYPM